VTADRIVRKVAASPHFAVNDRRRADDCAAEVSRHRLKRNVSPRHISRTDGLIPCRLHAGNRRSPKSQNSITQFPLSRMQETSTTEHCGKPMKY